MLPLLEQRGYRVRCLTRRPEALFGRVSAKTEVVAGDVLDRAALNAALEGVHTAFYFVHSMGAERDFEVEDRIAAANFAERNRAPRFAGSSIWEASAIKLTGCQSTSVVAKKLVMCCGPITAK